VGEIILKDVNKVYEGGFHAVKNFNLEIHPREFIIFVGPSGCGKSTTLRMIAGLEEISDGELWINDCLANFMDPQERELAMVFQNYALYPNMTVYKNIAFSLEIRGVKKAEVDRRVKETAALLGLEQVLDRRPKDLSGGQKQRVAIGNAIIRNPEVLLMDEPLSNLDAKLRGQMRVELIKLHEKLGNTIIYVTHDQIEAMTLGTRIVVMNKGEIQQVDTPERIYSNPVNKFVAGFIGSPSMNFIDCQLKKNGDKKLLAVSEEQSLVCGGRMSGWLDEAHEDAVYVMGLRPEAILDSYRREKQHRTDLGEGEKIRITITHRELLGNEVLLYFTYAGVNCCMKADVQNSAQKGDSMDVWFDMDELCLFDRETEENIFYTFRR
jgi:multiple sugar transport system ATP-binding protein